MIRRFSSLLLATCLAAACSTRLEHEPHRADHTPDAININTATVAELERLPGVGPKTAAAMIEHREKYGPFRRLEHLMLIRGISETRFLEMRPLLRAE